MRGMSQAILADPMICAWRSSACVDA